MSVIIAAVDTCFGIFLHFFSENNMGESFQD